ncbi:methyltransferase [Mesorhizobium sp. L-8-10]|uniref:methyltransferase n=1 Tax=Mesorhizobium sp. L-8-10 TaxID=2744523 RepID=UPI0019293436
MPVRADACLLKHAIHDWIDDRADSILRICRRPTAPRPGSRSSKVSTAHRPAGREPRLHRQRYRRVCTDGRRRGKAEFRGLRESTGSRLTRIVPTQMPVTVIEGVSGQRRVR